MHKPSKHWRARLFVAATVTAGGMAMWLAGPLGIALKLHWGK